ncbi:MAG: DNA-processing protein DprA, partial [Bacteroidales bacterium]
LTDSVIKKAEEEWNLMQKQGIELCFYTDDHYPKRLKNCHDAPYLFYYKGDAVFNRPKVIAVVGTRNASIYGKDAVKKIITEISSHDISVISGLAMGIDAVAHEQALEYNLNTVAVMGAGFGYIYPHSNEKLAKRIIENGGTLLSEYSFNVMPEKQNFPKRNRIIAGMADATVVVESAPKGGSIITAFIAHSYNRDVFAVPGSIFSKTQDGCHELVRTNMAALIHSGQNLIEMMGWEERQTKTIQRKLFVELTENEKKVLEVIQTCREIAIDDLIQEIMDLTPSKIVGILLSLELKGVVECKPGKIYTTIF